ncbi:hypothetical protein AAGC94_05380 [Clostridium sporogenes]|uniref:DUF7210 family protein n=1 Tax=Bacteria TaxID=2 RepID=UPI002298D64A|nr:hypothetical protein [Proteus mirabilis]EMF0798387.1 hypothetical protein [Proteus mirabilis]MDM3613267.1 hypothetical protein [Proteus mirabilis]HCU0913611.1 hypothetical protein [Proteus mirabilis]HEK1040154.1 hypothetical protein [Proteus mirabilis]HEK3059226.1 hypothetical protein [Proteus mirabilis]
MKLIILRAIYFGGVVVTEGKEIETLEQHGRELIQKGYAKEKEVVHPAIEPEPEPEPEPKKNTKAKKEK